MNRFFMLACAVGAGSAFVAHNWWFFGINAFLSIANALIASAKEMAIKEKEIKKK
jgi:hypothetical protein